MSWIVKVDQYCSDWHLIPQNYNIYLNREKNTYGPKSKATVYDDKSKALADCRGTWEKPVEI